MTLPHRFAVEPETATPAGGKLIAVVGAPNDGDVPQWNDAAQRYEPQPPAAGSTLDSLTDVDVPTPSDGDQLVYDAGAGAWVNQAPPSANADPLEFTRRWWLHQVVIPASTLLESLSAPVAFTGVGTTAADNDDDAHWIRNSTSAVSGNSCYWQAITSARLRRGYRARYVCRMKTYTSIANVRLWFGFTDTTPVSASDPAAAHLAMFRFDTGAGDVNWQCCTKDGTTLGVSDSGVAVATDTPYLFRIELDASAVRFYINGSLVATRTTTLPGANNNMGVNASLTTLSANVRSFKYARQWGDLLG